MAIIKNYFLHFEDLYHYIWNLFGFYLLYNIICDTIWVSLKIGDKNQKIKVITQGVKYVILEK